MSELGGDEQGPVAARVLPPDTRALAEALAERLDLAVGPCRLVIEVHNGVLRHVVAQRKIGARELGNVRKRPD